MARKVNVTLVLTESAEGKIDIEVRVPSPGVECARLVSVAAAMVAFARNPPLLIDRPKIGEVSMSCPISGGSRLKQQLKAERS